MRRMLLIFALIATGSALAQTGKAIEFSTPAQLDLDKGVTVNVQYQLPDDDPFVTASKADPSQAPTTCIWFWGDEERNAKQRNVSELPHQDRCVASHVYKKTGTFGILLLVNDAKKRNIRQLGLKVKIQQPVEIETPAP